MRCPLCKEPVQDKETLQVHYITSCTGYQQDGATGQGDTPGSGATISGSRKARVTFLWKKSLPTLEHEIYLFSTFDQVKLEWESSIEIFKSGPTEVARGTYGDCQLVVSGELYPTKPIVIDQESQTVHIQLPQVGVIEEIPAPQDDWRHRLADDDRRAAGTSVDPAAVGTAVDPGAAISHGAQPKDKMKFGQMRRGDESSAVVRQESQGMSRVGHTVDDRHGNGRPGDAHTADDYNSRLAPGHQLNGPTFQRQLSDGASNSAVVDSNRGTSHQSRDSRRRQFGHLGHEVASGTATNVASEYSRNGKQHLGVARSAQVVGDSLHQASSGLASRHDTHVDEMKEVSSIYHFPVNQGPADSGRMAQQQSSHMDVDIQSVESTLDSNQSTSDAGRQQHFAQTQLPWNSGNVQPTVVTRHEHETRHARHRPLHPDLANTRTQQLQVERDQFAVELSRYGETIKALSIKLELQQERQDQLLQSEKELQRIVSQLKKLLGEKDVMEQTYRSTVADLRQQNENLQRDARSVYQENRELQQAQQAAEVMKNQLQIAAADKEKAVETLRKVQEKLEHATKYNTHLQEELVGCQEQLLQERTASTGMNKVNLLLQENVKRLEADIAMQQQEQQLTESHMVSLRSNLEGLQLTNEALKEQLDQLEIDRAGIVDDRTKKETELTHKTRQYQDIARQYQDMASKCLLLEKEVKEREKEFDALEQQQSTLKNALTAANLQKEEVVGAMESVEAEKTGLEREVVTLKAQLANEQSRLQQIADDKRELTAQIEAGQSDRKQHEALVATISALREERKEQDDRFRELQRHGEETKKRRSSEDSQRLHEANVKVKELEGHLKNMEEKLSIQTDETSRAVVASQAAEGRCQEATKTVTERTDERNKLQRQFAVIESQYRQNKNTLKETEVQLQQSVAECVLLKEQLKQREEVEEGNVQQCNVLEQERDNFRDEVERLVRVNETQQSQMRQQLQEQLTQLTQREAERSRLEQDLAQYAQQHEERDTTIAELTEARGQLIADKERLQKKLQLQKDQTQKLQSHLDARTAELERRKDNEDAEKRENKSQLKKAEDKNKSLEEEVARLKQTRHQLESEKRDLQSKLASLSGKDRTTEKEISDLSDANCRLLMEIKELQSKQEKLTRCLDSTISKERDVVRRSKELEAELVKLKRDHDTAQLKLDAQQAENESAEQRAAQAETHSSYLTKKLRRSKERKQSLKQELEELRKVRADIQDTEIKNADLQAQLNALSAKLDSAEKSERTLQSHNEFVEKERQSMADKLSTVESEREKLGKKNDQLNQELLALTGAYKELHQRLKQSRQHSTEDVGDEESLKRNVGIQGTQEDKWSQGITPHPPAVSQNQSSQDGSKRLQPTRPSSRRSLEVSSLSSQRGRASGVSQPATKSVRSPPVTPIGGHVPDLLTSSTRSPSSRSAPVNWDWLVVGARVCIPWYDNQTVAGVVKYIRPQTGPYHQRMVGVKLDMPVVNDNMSGYMDDRGLFKCEASHVFSMPVFLHGTEV